MCQVVVQMGWALFSFDVSSAFLQGLTFDEQDKEACARAQDSSSGMSKERRVVHLEIPKDSLDLIKKLDGFGHFNPIQHVLQMIKGGFGLKDAPRMWRKRLHQLLTEYGMKALQSDNSVYCLWSSGRLVLILSTHVDDLKGGGTEEATKGLFSHLEKAVGAGTLDWLNFEHCGVKHYQDKGLGEIVQCMDHYVQQLRKISSSELTLKSDPEAPASVTLTALFTSLLGGLAWLTQLRADIAIYVVALQRRMKNPLIKHIKRCNAVLSYAKRHKVVARYKKLPGDIFRIVGVSDSAYKVEEDESRAMVGDIVLLMGTSAPAEEPFGQCTLIDYACRRQKRVCRSTFAAEIRGLNDCTERARVIQLAVEEVFYGPITASQALKIEELHDSGAAASALRTQLELAVDAKSVYTAVEAKETKVPSESSLLSSIQAARKLFDMKRLRRLHWIDTRDMIADGLNKGAVNRQAIQDVLQKNLWSRVGDKPCTLTALVLQTKACALVRSLCSYFS